MPIYEFVCRACGFRFENYFQKRSDADEPQSCPACKGKSDKVISSPNIKFGLGCSLKDDYCKTRGKLNYVSDIQKEQKP